MSQTFIKTDPEVSSFWMLIYPEVLRRFSYTLGNGGEGRAEGLWSATHPKWNQIQNAKYHVPVRIINSSSAYVTVLSGLIIDFSKLFLKLYQLLSDAFLNVPPLCVSSSLASCLLLLSRVSCLLISCVRPLSQLAPASPRVLAPLSCCLISSVCVVVLCSVSVSVRSFLLSCRAQSGFGFPNVTSFVSLLVIFFS